MGDEGGIGADQEGGTGPGMYLCTRVGHCVRRCVWSSEWVVLSLRNLRILDLV